LTVSDRASVFALRWLLLAVLLFQSSCSTMAYIEQASAGQYDLNVRARDIDELIREKHVDARTRKLLSHVALIKRFGEEQGLAATDNYRKYVRLDRPYVVWVTSAAEPLHFRSRKWTFPVVGSFEYLGWFKQDAANAFAADLKSEGLDVDVRGSSAYSTTGFFEDPVLSTMLVNGKAGLGDMTNTVLHEMTHATFFVRHQSTLNESVANFVGDRLAERYLLTALGPDAQETTAYFASERMLEGRGRSMRAAYRTLQALYASSKPDAQKLEEKNALLKNLRRELSFSRPITNATLIQYKTYNSGQEELSQLLLACEGSFPRLLRSLKKLETMTLPKPQEKEIGGLIVPLVAGRCR
jgi:predicted aminopeptidase